MRLHVKAELQPDQYNGDATATLAAILEDLAETVATTGYRAGKVETRDGEKIGQWQIRE